MVIDDDMKQIKAYPTYYATKSGKVWSGNTDKFLTPYKKRNGYLQVNLWKNGKKETFTVHRLVYEAFNGSIPEGLQVNHINENKADNRLDNLNLMTAKENCNHGSRLARIAKSRGKSVVLHDIVSAGKFHFNSESELARHFNIARMTYQEKVANMKKKGKNRIKIKGVEYLVKEA